LHDCACEQLGLDVEAVGAQLESLERRAADRLETSLRIGHAQTIEQAEQRGERSIADVIERCDRAGLERSAEP